ncbi:XdhC/CoxI family protein [Sphingobium sp. TA15]|nr:MULTISPECIES: XdhC family protein [Sphingomonadaceae]EPR17813.1 XdhC/CoxI family protein [Sphingobium indicum IP26]MBY2930864.1 XdhC family protein [Sphingomonadales bacterium 56]MBY2960937.1 XdhC family protein [Sphingomonadales bacterium 58]BDD66132.1 XdhC/CoxI family protein [Sphingobium sp. TA15]AAR05953.1 ORFE [Sphingobium indicum B90A]
MAEAADDLDVVIDAAALWLAAGRHVALATVIETWGSAPRRAGSHLVIRDDGIFEGSVSGGCVEGDVIVQALELIAAGGGFRRLDYGVADAQAWEVGLACGGRISILLQTVDGAHFPPALIERIVDARAQGLPLGLATDLTSGATRENAAPLKEWFFNLYPPRRRLAIVGAVHIAQLLVPMARLAGYETTVIDPRGMFAAAARFDQPVDENWPDEALDRWRPDGGSAVVSLTHDPKLDDPALARALNSPAFYIGALGSRKTHAARLERLGAAGFTDKELARIHGPAGLPIGAAGPAEIAVSILAEMTTVLRSSK